jgi:hypothetical protein
MPDGPPPGGDEEKIIINGGVAKSVLEETCSLIYRRVEAGHGFTNSRKLVEMANELEDMAFAFAKEALKGVAFTGPYPKSMK